jgi:hypothetical protein
MVLGRSSRGRTAGERRLTGSLSSSHVVGHFTTRSLTGRVYFHKERLNASQIQERHAQEKLEQQNGRAEGVLSWREQ